MENFRVVQMMVVVTSVMVMVSLVASGDPIQLHRVGGSKGWRQDVNYTEWSAQEHVIVCDWLMFVFDKRYFNVLEVNKTSYENCIDRDFIKNVTRGGRDVVQLTDPKTYYYISGGGYCFHGMKVAVNVEEYQEPVPANAPSPSKIVSASILPSVYTCIWIIVANVLYVNLVSMGIL
ncbi:lamin-like protein [Abrus precatorius]|uniref:Lamin-like protein n=1 Tax=Abrus precatorius TaxID=3816 RepID=A0A8B8LR48_ABRPR|nr:lamin-like protein [Abrus precatorius]